MSSCGVWLLLTALDGVEEDEECSDHVEQNGHGQNPRCCDENSSGN